MNSELGIMDELSLPLPNLPLLRKVLDHIDTNPKEWQQGTWANDCGTAFCVAGHALNMDGQVQNTRDGITIQGKALWQSCECEDGHRFGDVEIAHCAGMKVLGITDAEADDLFAGDNSRHRVQVVAERIAQRAGERL